MGRLQLFLLNGANDLAPLLSSSTRNDITRLVGFKTPNAFDGVQEAFSTGALRGDPMVPSAPTQCIMLGGSFFDGSIVGIDYLRLVAPVRSASLRLSQSGPLLPHVSPS